MLPYLWLSTCSTVMLYMKRLQDIVTGMNTNPAILMQLLIAILRKEGSGSNCFVFIVAGLEFL